MTNPPAARRYLLYERDPEGVPYAIEVVEAARWSAAYLDPPDRDEADVRLLRLRHGRPPEDRPPWLVVEVQPDGISDLVATYDAGARASRTPSALAWRACPWRREPHPSLREFLDALVEGATFPLDPPEGDTRREEERQRIAERYEAFAPLAQLNADALERWFAVRFGSPEAAVDALLLARVEERDRSWATRLRFLREAATPPGSALAFDRKLLLEQASPRRALREGLPPAVLASLDEWMRRYRFEYDQHYARVRRDALAALTRVESARDARDALTRLNRLASLGPPERAAEAALDEAVAALTSMPVAPGEGATTADVTLGGTHPAIEAVRDALAAVEGAMRARLARLAQALSSRILADEGLAELERVLRAMQASETADLASVFDDGLLERLDRVLADEEPSPFARLADDFPVVTDSDVDLAAATFRMHLVAAVSSAPNRRIRLKPTARLG